MFRKTYFFGYIFYIYSNMIFNQMSYFNIRKFQKYLEILLDLFMGSC